MPSFLLFVRSSPGGEITERGTGWFCRPDRLVTAAHVVTLGGKWVTEILDCSFSILLKLPDRIIEMQPVDLDLKNDIAVLEPIGYRAHACDVLAIRGSLHHRDAWHAPGYPKQHDEALFTLNGFVTSVGDRCQLEVAQGTEPPRDGQQPWAGMSGAPVMVGGAAVGLVLQTTRNENTAWAVGLTALYRLVPSLAPTRKSLPWFHQRLCKVFERDPALQSELRRNLLDGGHTPEFGASSNSALTDALLRLEAGVVLQVLGRLYQSRFATPSASSIPELIELLLPMCFDWNRVSRVYTQVHSRAEVLEVPVATATIAEIVMAGAHERPCSFVESPRGRLIGAGAVLPPVESGIDVDGTRLYQNIIDYFAVTMRVQARDEPRRTIEIRVRLDYFANMKNQPKYVLLSESFAEPQGARAAIARARKEIPSLCFVRLNESQVDLDQYTEEINFQAYLEDIFLENES